MGELFKYDVFLSHSAKDKPTVRQIAEKLKADGIRVWFDEWEIRPGDNIPYQIEQGLESSRILVLCMSANAFGSDWAQLESYTFRFRDPLNKERRFIPVRLDEAEVKGTLAQFRYIDLNNGFSTAMDALSVICREDLPLQFHSFAKNPDWLALPDQEWRGTPGALLRADLAIVPFHGRQEELVFWKEWAFSKTNPIAGLLTGPGGMGKTRLARELCLHLRKEGVPAGFLHCEDAGKCQSYLQHSSDERMLIVLDYAETAGNVVSEILRIIRNRNLKHTRLLLLARGAGSWWSSLRRAGGGIVDLLSPEPTKLHPLSVDIPSRRISFHLAAEAFAGKLGTSADIAGPDDISEGYYDRTLLLHMSALLGIMGVEARGMDPILEVVLGREANYFAEQLNQHNLSNLERGFERAMGVISACGGMHHRQEAIETLRAIGYFMDQPVSTIETVADLLHNCYPGNLWIEPVQPDLLMEFLIDKAMEEDPDDFLNIVIPK
jgi:hypothetical protein